MPEAPYHHQDASQGSDHSDYIAKLEAQVARSRDEIVTLSQLVMDVPRSPIHVLTERFSGQSGGLSQETLRAMFAVMAMSLHLTRVPLVMRFGFFKRRHQRRLAVALRHHNLIDPDWYAATYPEVEGSGEDPAIYFVTKGIEAGHAPHPQFVPESLA